MPELFDNDPAMSDPAPPDPDPFSHIRDAVKQQQPHQDRITIPDEVKADNRLMRAWQQERAETRRKGKEQEEATKLAKRGKRKAPSAPQQRYTGRLAREWAKRQGWHMEPGSGERFDFRTKRYMDGPYGSDITFKHKGLTIYIQGAGYGEVDRHWNSFTGRHGLEDCPKIGATFLYLEFRNEDDNEPRVTLWSGPFGDPREW